MGRYWAKYPVLGEQSCRQNAAFQPCDLDDPRPADRCLRDQPRSCVLGLTLSWWVELTTIPNTRFDEKVLLPAVPKKTAKSSSTSFAGMEPSSLAWEPGLWECGLWDQNCIKDYFGPRMSLISQVLTVVCRLEDLNFPIISHANQEKTGFWKAHVKNEECRCLRTFLTISGLAVFLSTECSKPFNKPFYLHLTAQTTKPSDVLCKLRRILWGRKGRKC